MEFIAYGYNRSHLAEDNGLSVERDRRKSFAM